MPTNTIISNFYKLVDAHASLLIPKFQKKVIAVYVKKLDAKKRAQQEAKLEDK